MSVSLASKNLPKSVVDGVLRTIEPFVRLRANGKGVCSTKTRVERQQFYLRIVAELRSPELSRDHGFPAEYRMAVTL